MKFVNRLYLGLAFVSAVTLQSNGHAQNEPQPDPDWPCIQVLIPKISAASIWAGPPVTDIDVDKNLERLIKPLIASELDKKNSLTEKKIKSYISQTKNISHNKSLTYLFKGFLDAFNTKRQSQITTIKRYTKAQRATALKIENMLDEIVKLKSQQLQFERTQEIESELYWLKKIFKQREKSFSYLCELPQELSQHAGEIARMLSYLLK